MRRVFAFLLVSLGSVGAAHADVGPRDESCTVDKRCKGEGVSCGYFGPDPDAGASCRAEAESRGLVNVCSHGGGTVGENVFCPKGKGESPKGGCRSSCTIGGETTMAGLPIGAAIALAWLWRRRRR